MIRIINFSGGKTSALMTILNYRPGDLVIFTDTGREHPKTYKFINDFEAHENIPIIRIQYEGGFRGLLEKKKFKIFPNRVKRICTYELKIQTVKRWLRKNYGKQEYEWLIGFRADEKNRVLKYQSVNYIHPKFPLFDEGVTKEMVNQYWLTKPYNLEIPHILGNCTLCFLKGKNAIISIMRAEPELAKEWIEDEEISLDIYGKQDNGLKSGRRYFPDITYRQLFEISQRADLFSNKPLDNITPAYDCSCTN
jgi:3'-phosphoadenosine 5'-phosphosulfate sulfotransferase (PAPS reductase)/FAD synthetase